MPTLACAVKLRENKSRASGFCGALNHVQERARGKKEFKKLGTGEQGLAQHTLGDAWSSQVKNHFSTCLILCVVEEDI